MKKLSGVLVFLLVLGCSTSSSIQKKEVSPLKWNVIEKQIEEVIKVWGAPTKIEKITKDGNEHHVYTWQVTTTRTVGNSSPLVYRDPRFGPVILDWGNPGKRVTETHLNLLWVDQNGRVYDQQYSPISSTSTVVRSETQVPKESTKRIEKSDIGHAKRIKEMSAMAETKDPQVVETMIALLNDKDYRIQTHAIQILGQIKDQRAVEPLIATLQDPNAIVRNNAAFVLGQMGDHRAVDPLTIVTSKDKDSRVRLTAETALKQLKDSLGVKDGETSAK